jgi:hypothetical protein
MRVIHVFGEPYCTYDFEEEVNEIGGLGEMWDKINNREGHYVCDESLREFEAENLEFPGVTLTKKFIFFIRDMQDYDECKHENWYLVDEVEE